jgi:putative transposase
VLTFFHRPAELVVRLVSFLKQAFLRCTQPSRQSIVLCLVIDLTRRKVDLIAEDALLRQQLIVLQRQIK